MPILLLFFRFIFYFLKTPFKHGFRYIFFIFIIPSYIIIISWRATSASRNTQTFCAFHSNEVFLFFFYIMYVISIPSRNDDFVILSSNFHHELKIRITHWRFIYVLIIIIHTRIDILWYIILVKVYVNFFVNFVFFLNAFHSIDERLRLKKNFYFIYFMKTRLYLHF